MAGDARPGAGGAGMRTSWWACLFVGVLTCSLVLTGWATYQHFNQPPLSAASVEALGQNPPDQKPEQQLVAKDEERLQTGDTPPAGLEPDQPADTQQEARLEDATAPAAVG